MRDARTLLIRGGRRGRARAASLAELPRAKRKEMKMLAVDNPGSQNVIVKAGSISPLVHFSKQ